MKRTNGEHRSLLLEAIDLNRLQKEITQPTPWTQAKPEELLTIRRSDLDLFLSRIIVKEDHTSPYSSDPDVAKIQNLVAKYFRVTTSAMLGSSKRSDIVWPRHVAVYMTKQFSASSDYRIAAYFGFRHHNSIPHSCKVVQDRIDTEPSARASVSELHSQIQKALGPASWPRPTRHTRPTRPTNS